MYSTLYIVQVQCEWQICFMTCDVTRISVELHDNNHELIKTKKGKQSAQDVKSIILKFCSRRINKKSDNFMNKIGHLVSG